MVNKFRANPTSSYSRGMMLLQGQGDGTFLYSDGKNCRAMARGGRERIAD